ncbi:MAG: polysaccharide biosynthesis protein, partial [Desulfohalobiaceae bacterium]
MVPSRANWSSISTQLRNRNFWLILGIDIFLLSLAHILAYFVRFEGWPATERWQQILYVLPWLVPSKMLIFHVFGLYQGMWRYFATVDLQAVLKATFIATTAALSAVLLLNRFEGFSRSVFILDGIFTFLAVCGSRFAIRVYHQKFPCSNNFAYPAQAQPRKRLLVLGAGDAGEKVAREVLDNQALPYKITGFLDDDPGKQGKRIHGLPVLGTTAEVRSAAERTGAQELVIAMPSAGRENIKKVVEICQSSGLPFKTLPGMGEIISDKVSIRALREVSYKDLLGRPQVRLENQELKGLLQSKRVLVTGAGGSIGSELCRQLLRFEPQMLVLLEAGEENLHRLEMELLHEHGFSSYVPVLGKVQDRQLLQALFQQYQPQLVLHAAAYKHVPLVEKNPWEAVYNNIFASHRLIQASIKHQVERFILVSTDKAVRPTNVMGASKRMTEMLMQAHFQGSRTRFMAVRFGNVLGSSGSVLPLFKRQIEKGGPLTVTHPKATRYFMAIEEAGQLILQAAAMGRGGEIFVLEMGTPVNISQMAKDFIRICGKEPDTEIEIKYIGLRP